MLQYALRRLLLMIPTFFLVSMVVFTLVNLAPGNPGQSAGFGEERNGAAASEAALVFRRQFDLDKPVLLNLRPWMGTEEVRALLVSAHALAGAAPPAEAMEARRALEDGGAYLVPHLVALLDDPSPELRRHALAQLPLAAALPLVSERIGDPAEARTENRRRVARNQAFRDWHCEPVGAGDCVEATRARWTAWWATEAARYTFSGTGAVEAALTDTRFARYWWKLLHLDLGVSPGSRVPVAETLLTRLSYSIGLSVASIALAYLLAVPLGVWSAVRAGSAAETASTVGLFLLYSLPSFFVATVLLRVLAEGQPLAWFPVGGFSSDDPPPTTLGRIVDVAWHLALPVATSTAVALAALSRYARTGVLDVLRADHVRTARAKGLEEAEVIVLHVARNGMIPIVTLLGGMLPALVSGSVVVEVIFNIPGVGSWLVESITARDYNAVMAILLASGLLTLVGVLLSDLACAALDPRIQLG